MSVAIESFWGKTVKGSTDDRAFHPALYHMLDVANAADVLLAQGSPRLMRAIARTWGDAEVVRLWLPFLIATHDLGKISAAFQGQPSTIESRAQRERLQRNGVHLPDAKAEHRHELISAVWQFTHLPTHEPRIPRDAISVICDAMGGHHGRFVQDSLRQLQSRIAHYERPHAAQWDAWRYEAFVALREIFLPNDAPPLPSPKMLRAATVALTGLCIHADWIGSNSKYFPASAHVPLEQYRELSRERAHAGVRDADLTQPLTTNPYSGFASLFPEIEGPRPLQQAIDELPEELLREPCLVVIEAPTGEGKTEAAQMLTQRLATSLGQHELFFALPTMATSNQIFKRLSEFYHRHYGQAVKLTHSQAGLVEKELRQMALAQDSDPVDPDGASADQILHWFASSKKGLLAPIGVGTVDQVELGGLNVRHAALRLFALADKVVVIDEVHAYDTYMSTILEHTLGWLAQLGSSVILLSATLPIERHRALAQSYLKGRGNPNAAVELSSDLSYPVISIYNAQQHYRCSPAPFRPEQRIAFSCYQRGDAEAEAQRLLELVREGGAVARICNRVDDAQAIYRALQTHIPADDTLLLHARFPLDWRQEHEQRVEEWLGKNTRRPSEQRLIVVGTQVLEQSLDYDVDVMVSDLAPIDLLLQRAGRLHRHKRDDRVAQHQQAKLWIAVPTNDGVPDWRRWEAIYQPYLLWRTWEVLQERSTDAARFKLPEDYRPLIEQVYRELGAADAPHAAQRDASYARLQRQQLDHRGQARVQLFPDFASPDRIMHGNEYEFQEDQDGQLSGTLIAKTRLGDRITVVPIYRIGEQYALDPYLGDPLPSSDPNYSFVQRALFKSIPISDPQLIRYFRTTRDPAAQWPWKEPPRLLRYVYPLYLDKNGHTIIEQRRIQLDRQLGLVIEKEQL